MSANITAEEVAKRAGVSLENLNQEYSDDHIREGLAELCDPWRLTGEYLKLSSAQLNAIDENYKKVEEKRIAVLQRRKEDSFDATYLLLVKAFLAMKKAKQALEVCKIFKRSNSIAASSIGAADIGVISKEPGLGMEADTNNTCNTDRKAQGGAMLNFSSSMKTQELAKWLHLKISDPEFEDDIKKLEVNKINGRTFLRLPNNDKLREKLDLSIGGEELLISIAEELSEGTTTNSGEAASLPPIEPDIPWCSTKTPRRVTADSDILDIAAEGGMQSAYVPQDALWVGFKELRVEFLNKIPDNWTCGDGEAMNSTNILGWANEWSLKGDGKIPKFVKAKGGASQIRVSFNVLGIRNSYIGKRAESVKHDQPTMNLDLHSGGISNDYKRHVVIHEFGHALGLGHEHQRSNFWNCIKKYTDVPKMKKALGVSDTQFNIDWEADHSSELGYHTEKYDPDSIMHYWFKREWLTHGYSNENKVKTDRDSKKLDSDVAFALLGIHKRHQNLAHEPSKLDIDLLKQLYGGIDESGAPPRVTTDDGEMEVEIDYDKFNVENRFLSCLVWMEGNDKRTVRIYDESAHMWKKIGRELGLEVGALKSIGRDGVDDDDRITTVLGKWYDNASNLPNGSKYPKTWKGLISLLRNSELDDVATKVHSALSAPISNVRGTLQD